MLQHIKSQLTDESESGAHEDSTGGGIANASRSDSEMPIRDDAAKDSATDAADSQEPTIELDVVFGLLKNRRRRDVLRLLTETTEEMRIGELAEQIAARECEKDVSQINSQERKRVYVGLYQCHLPKLADVGVIEYNKPRGTVERGPAFDPVHQYLPSEERPADGETRDRNVLESLSNILSTGRQFL